MERYTCFSGILAPTEVHHHFTILVNEYQKKLQHVFMVSRSGYPHCLGWKKRMRHFSLVACKQMIQECDKTLRPIKNKLSKPFEHNCAIQLVRNTVSNVHLMNLLQGSRRALKELHQIIQPVCQPASKSTPKSSNLHYFIRGGLKRAKAMNWNHVLNQTQPNTISWVTLYHI